MISDPRERFDALAERSAAFENLRASGAILMWDQQLQMPPAAVLRRGDHVSVIRQRRHETITDPAIAELLDAPQPLEAEFEQGSDEAALIRVIRRQHERLARIPMDFVAEFSENASASGEAWQRAKQDDDFSIVAPYLERTLEISRRFSSYFPEAGHPADPLIAEIDPDVRVADLRPIFAELRSGLAPLASDLSNRSAAAPELPQTEWSDRDTDLALVRNIASHFGFDFDRGRLDILESPFTIRFAADDVRLACAFKDGDPAQALFSGMHETGHALYEQGVDRAYDGNLLGQGVSDGVHESQARLFENIIGRSRHFWNFFYPRLAQTHPQLAQLPLDDFLRAINRVGASPIRTRADEVTYNLHVALRFDLEVQMLEGSLSVEELPEAWNSRMRDDLGITPSSHSEGVLQEPHWYAFGFAGGSFQQYAIGSVLSAQFYDAALSAHPSIPEEIENGEFSTLLAWLTENVYRYGAKYPADDLVLRATGAPMTVDPFIHYLKDKYGAL